MLNIPPSVNIKALFPVIDRRYGHTTPTMATGASASVVAIVGVVLYRLCHFTFILQLEGLLLLAKNKKNRKIRPLFKKAVFFYPESFVIRKKKNEQLVFGNYNTSLANPPARARGRVGTDRCGQAQGWGCLADAVSNKKRLAAEMLTHFVDVGYTSAASPSKESEPAQ